MIPKLFVANWKMNKTFAESIDFCEQHGDALSSLAVQTNKEIVICPSFPALFSLAEMLSDTLVNVGAQTCSSYEKGAFTGQVSAHSLEQVGCTHCIIGHSEQRQLGITNEMIAQQAIQLITHEIQPIICIGETKQQHAKGTSKAILSEQLAPLFELLPEASTQLNIAYEPVWAIGTGKAADSEYLTDIFSWLADTIEQATTWRNYRLLYGGSIDENNIGAIAAIPQVRGFLIGSASLDFQKFEKIVSLGT